MSDYDEDDGGASEEDAGWWDVFADSQQTNIQTLATVSTAAIANHIQQANQGGGSALGSNTVYVPVGNAGNGLTLSAATYHQPVLTPGMKVALVAALIVGGLIWAVK